MRGLLFFLLLAFSANLASANFFSQNLQVSRAAHMDGGAMVLEGKTTVATPASAIFSPRSRILYGEFRDPLVRDTRLRAVFARADLGGMAPPLDFVVLSGAQRFSIDLGQSRFWGGRIGQIGVTFELSEGEGIALQALNVREISGLGERARLAWTEFWKPETFLPSSVNLLYGPRLFGISFALLLTGVCVVALFLFGVKRRETVLCVVLGAAMIFSLRSIRDDASMAGEMWKTWFSQPVEKRTFANLGNFHFFAEEVERELGDTSRLLWISEPGWPFWIHGDLRFLPREVMSLREWQAAGKPEVALVTWGNVEVPEGFESEDLTKKSILSGKVYLLQ